MAELPDYEPHPFTNIIARIPATDDEYKQLEKSICELGLINPIVIYQNQILAGLTRYQILQDHAGEIEFKSVTFTGTDEQALQLVIDENLARRHLDESERGMVAARLTKLPSRSNYKSETNELWAAERLRVGRHTVRNALDLWGGKNPELMRQDLIDAVDQRLLKLRNAAQLIKIPASTVQKILESNNPNQAAAKIVKDQNRQNRQMEMARVAIKEARESVDQTKRFGVIYADPPWTFETYSEAGKSKSAENHYPTMELEDIKNIHVPAASNCALFLWTTVAHLENAIDVLNAWGFDYKSAYAWHKVDIGTGYWSRNNLELLLLGIIGDVPAPTPEQISEQCLTVKQGKHSEKPEVFADLITKMFPDVPKLEMFARKTNHKGEHWTYWGNEVGVEIEPKRNGNGNGKRKAKTPAQEESGIVQGDSESHIEQQGKVDSENT